MPRYQPYSNPKIDDRQLLRTFYLATASLTTVQEVANFLKDLLSVTETAMLARRLRVAEMLAAKKTYDVIADELNISKATIARVQRWLDHGHNGYRVALTRLGKATAIQDSLRARREKERRPFTLAHLQRKYPGRLIDPTIVPEMIAEAQELMGQVKRRRSVRRALRGHR